MTYFNFSDSIRSAATDIRSDIAIEAINRASDIETTTREYVFYAASALSLVAFRAELDIAVWQSWSDRSFSHAQSAILAGIEFIAYWVGFAVGFTVNDFIATTLEQCPAEPIEIIETPVAAEVPAAEPELPTYDDMMSFIMQKTPTGTVKELKAICKENGIKGYSKLRKAELQALVAAI